jgi:hypothetical protein
VGRAGRTLVIAAVVAVAASTVIARGPVTYLYNLASFAGPLRDDGVRVVVDPNSDETYTIYQNVVRIYSPSGMEVFSFGEGLDLGQILDVAAERSGDVLLLSLKDARTFVTRCDFRGVPKGEIKITGLPAGLAFGPNRMILRGGLFYFASLMTSSVIVTDSSGAFRSHFELLPAVEADERQKIGAESVGFTVDDEGSLFFTVPVLFSVYKRWPDGKVTAFGTSGSAPGKFGVVAGIATDKEGRIFVADKLKCAVLVFDKDFAFLTEFGYRGSRPENLIVPDDVAVDRKGRIYVAQMRKRGVSVFAFN